MRTLLCIDLDFLGRVQWLNLMNYTLRSAPTKYIKEATRIPGLLKLQPTIEPP